MLFVWALRAHKPANKLTCHDKERERAVAMLMLRPHVCSEAVAF